MTRQTHLKTIISSKGKLVKLQDIVTCKTIRNLYDGVRLRCFGHAW